MLWKTAAACLVLMVIAIFAVKAARTRAGTPRLLRLSAVGGFLIAAFLAWANVGLQQRSTAAHYDQPPRVAGKFTLKKSDLSAEKREEQLLTFIKEAYSSRLEYAVVAIGAVLAFVFTAQYKAPAVGLRWLMVARALMMPPILVFLALSVYFGARTANALTGALYEQYSPLTYAPLISNWALQEEFFLYGFILAVVFLLVNFVEVLRQDFMSPREGTK